VLKVFLIMVMLDCYQVQFEPSVRTMTSHSFKIIQCTTESHRVVLFPTHYEHKKLSPIDIELQSQDFHETLVQAWHLWIMLVNSSWPANFSDIYFQGYEGPLQGAWWANQMALHLPTAYCSSPWR
jgi:hypothetical protein